MVHTEAPSYARYERHSVGEATVEQLLIDVTVMKAHRQQGRAKILLVGYNEYAGFSYLPQ